MSAMKRPRITSSAVRTTKFADGLSRTSDSSLTTIRRNRLLNEATQHRALQETSRATIEALTEAALEVGHVPQEDDSSMCLDDTTNDHSAIAAESESDDEINAQEHFDTISDTLRRLIKMSRSTKRQRRHDQRTRRQRNKRLHNSWTSQLPFLVESYLETLSSNSSNSFKTIDTNTSPNSTPETPSSNTPNAQSTDDTAETPSSNTPNTQSTDDTAETPKTPSPHIFHVILIGVREYERQQPIQQRHEELANGALIRHGCLGSSPSDPRIAFTLELLELYHQMRRHQSNFSIQSIVKVLCSLHNLTYTTTLRQQFSSAFDAYLEIIRQVDQRLTTLVSRDDKWKTKFNCPACGWQCANETPLKPARLHAMDGNNSLKRLENAGKNDEREFVSRYFISHDDVERFKHDVHAKKKEKPPQQDVPPSQTEDPAHEDKERDLICADNWTTTSTISEDTTKIFDQTGIFICVCRHGLIEFIVEMRKSGELAKYGLAVVDQQLKHYGADQGNGYDIGCNFEKTVSTSTLGPVAKQQNFQWVVDSFHGHAHERFCQVRNLPLYREGFGIEDFSTCERVFSASNSAARLVRYSSHFHWRQFIDLHFNRWDAERHEDIGKFLYSNYSQALGIIKNFTPLVDALKTELKITDADFVQWHQQELGYLRTVTSKPQYKNPDHLTYVLALEEYFYADRSYNLAVSESTFFVATPADFQGTGALSAEAKKVGRREQQERSKLQRELELKLRAVTDLERLLDITERWTPAKPEYQAALAFSKNFQFFKAVERLEGLVVQRLMELAKSNLAETGYKLRKHIATAITRRSSTLRKALDQYNALAPLQTPPRPILAYSDVITYTVLGEFEMLKCSQHNILQQPWASATNRAIAAKFFKIRRAHEEIVRLNVEVRRVEAWADYEDEELKKILQNISPNDAPLLPILKRFSNYRKRVNDVHCKNLNKIYALSGYTGTIPQRYGFTEVSPPIQDGEEDDDEVIEESVTEEAARLQDFIDEVND